MRLTLSINFKYYC